MTSIILVNYNGSKDTIECLESLNNIIDTSFEVYVIDNASKVEDYDYLADYIKNNKLKYKVYLEKSSTNLGFAGGNNIGIKMAMNNGKSDSILLLNNDTVVEPDFLSKLVNGLNKYDMTTSKILFDSKRELVWAAGGKIDKLRGIGKSNYFKSPATRIIKESSITFAPFCCVLFKKEVFEKLGLMTEEYFMYFEDADYCMKMKKSKMKMGIIPDSVIYHKVSASSGGFHSEFYLEWMTRNRLKFVKLYFGFITSMIAKFELFVKKFLYKIKGNKNSYLAIKKGERKI